MKKKWLIVCAFCMHCVILPPQVATEEDLPPNYEEFIFDLFDTFIGEMQNTFQLLYIKDGRNMSKENPDILEELGILFFAHHEATVEEARELEVRTTERLGFLINTHQGIRPFLKEYPFPVSRIEVKIGFFDEEKKCPYANGVAFVFQNHSLIRYNRSQDGKLVTILEEPYEEALNKVALRS